MRCYQNGCCYNTRISLYIFLYYILFALSNSVNGVAIARCLAALKVKENVEPLPCKQFMNNYGNVNNDNDNNNDTDDGQAHFVFSVVTIVFINFYMCWQRVVDFSLTTKKTHRKYR